ncbi:hypothetical protein FRC04_004866 [Tulasnella sp. 424]|nr:hypothetical protein FRC04_004866 [Tulasnella sp. 424]
MPKIPRIQETSRLSPKTNKYLQRLQEIKEEQQVLDLIEPQYQYPITEQVFKPVEYYTTNGKPYNFKKRIAQATKHTRIDITDCPSATLTYLIDTFPESDISFSYTNLLIPYIPTTSSLLRAYQVLPADTVVKYDSSNSSTQTQPTLPTGVDANMIAAIIATLQASGVGAQAQSTTTKTTKIKIKEPDTSRSSDFPDEEAQIQFALSYLMGNAQAWGDVILRDLLTTQTYLTSSDWDDFKDEFIKAFGDPDKEGTAIRKLEALSQGRPMPLISDVSRLTSPGTSKPSCMPTDRGSAQTSRMDWSTTTNPLRWRNSSSSVFELMIAFGNESKKRETTIVPNLNIVHHLAHNLLLLPNLPLRPPMPSPTANQSPSTSMPPGGGDCHLKNEHVAKVKDCVTTVEKRVTLPLLTNNAKELLTIHSIMRPPLQLLNLLSPALPALALTIPLLSPSLPNPPIVLIPMMEDSHRVFPTARSDCATTRSKVSALRY